MTQTPSIESLATVLADISSGQRIWFWMCSNVEEGVPALALQPFSEGGPRALFTAAENIPIPRDSLPSTGIAEVDSDGIINLASVSVEKEDILRLSEFTKRHIAEHPALARLRNIRLIKLSETKDIIARFQDGTLWKDVPYPVIAGTAVSELRVLSKMKPGRSAWYWMTEKGPSGFPYFVAKPDKVKPKKFAALVTSVQKRISDPGAQMTGIVRINAEGTFIFTSEEAPSVGVRMITLLQESYDAAEVLSGAYCVQIKDGTVVKKEQCQSVEPKEEGLGQNLSRQSAVLKSMTTASEVWFWLTSSDENGSPLLLLETDRNALKGAVRESNHAGEAVRGQMRLTSKGWVEFRIKDSYPNFIAPLAAFVRENHARWPALCRLKGARMKQRQGDETIDRQKDNDAWEGVPNPQ